MQVAVGGEPQVRDRGSDDRDQFDLGVRHVSKFAEISSKVLFNFIAQVHCSSSATTLWYLDFPPSTMYTPFLSSFLLTSDGATDRTPSSVFL